MRRVYLFTGEAKGNKWVETCTRQYDPQFVGLTWTCVPTPEDLRTEGIVKINSIEEYPSWGPELLEGWLS